MSPPTRRSTASTWGRVHALCLRMSRDRGEAEELVQDVFVRVWEKLGQFRGDSAFGTWVHRVGVNVVIERMRQKGRWRERHADGVDVADARDAMFVNSAGADIDLERAIACLPERARLVFLLHDVEGHKHREIAELTGLAVGTSKSPSPPRAHAAARSAARRTRPEREPDCEAARERTASKDGGGTMSIFDRWRPLARGHCR